MTPDQTLDLLGGATVFVGFCLMLGIIAYHTR